MLKNMISIISMPKWVISRRTESSLIQIPFLSFESHYCGAKTNKKYLEAGLNIARMYDLYKEKYIRENKPWVKSTYYRYILNTCYNIDFLIPKTHRCGKFEEIRLKKSQNTSISIEKNSLHDLHIAEKLAMQKQKNKVKLITIENSLLVLFDLENVITLPKTNTGSFFYKRKFTLYNLTAMTSSKQCYCAIWTECMLGWAGNDIASTFIQILNKVAADHANVIELICWYDSGVPQNRNYHISQAIL